MGSRKGGGQENQRWLEVPANHAQAELRKALDEVVARDADEVALRRVWARLADNPDLVPSLDQGPGYDQIRDQIRERGDDQPRRAQSRRPWFVVASLAGATATLAFLLLETKSEMRSARVATPAPPSLAAGVVGKRETVDRETVDQRSVLVAPATVRTGLGETLHLSLRGGTDVVVKSESAMVLDVNDRPTVAAGEVQFHVPPQPAGRPYNVVFGHYRVVVIGTRFRVNVNQRNAAVNVDEGVVEIWTDHRVARVAAGESWSSPAAASSAAPNLTTPPLPTVPTPGASSGGTARKANHRTGSSKSARGQVLALSSPAAGRASYPLVSPSASPASFSAKSAVTSGGARVPPSVADVGPALAPVPAAAPSPSAVPVTVPSAAAVAAQTPVDAANLVLAARAARAAGDSRRALGFYRTLAQKGGAVGENAEYEIGRVLRDGLRQPREAVSAWRTYRAQHPRGLLRIEADISVIETLVSIGDKAGAADEASDFIQRHPESERRLEIARLAGDLLRERGDCVSAVNAYDVALGGGRGRRDMPRSAADSVSFHRSVCLLRGDQTEGTAQLKAYLQSFPSGRFRADAQRLLGGAQSRAPANLRH